MQTHRVKCLLMGGQACVLYGAAEFSRDTDLVVLADAENLECLRNALDSLRAECIAVPAFGRRYLDMGLAVHFRCHHPDALNMRVDIMSRMRGMACFPDLWNRRTTLEIAGQTIDLLSLPDLVQAKKTQRDKDWPMLVRLVEANYFAHRDHPTEPRIEFWLRELRTPQLLHEVAGRFPDACERVGTERELLHHVRRGDDAAVRAALREEEYQEKEADRRYWDPLREELKRLRRERNAGNDASPRGLDR
jgi:PHD/YefM family antitoxin component YafN of YafNO toxin-antitoxin module